MKDRFLKWAATLGTVALVGGVLMVTASAHIGASHSPVTTDGPDLVSISATGDDTADFCFDEEVTSVDASPAEGDWALYGYDSSDQVSADSAEESGSDENCVEADFGSLDTDGDIREFTVGSVNDGEAEDRTGDDNPEGSAALDGFTGVGHTAAPELTGFDAAGDDITFTFDQLLDCSAITAADDAENFGYYESDGDIRIADSFVECNDEEVEVSFDDTPAEDNAEDDAERVFVIGAEPDGGTSDDINADAESGPDAAEPDIDAIDPSGDICAWDPDATPAAGDGSKNCAGFNALGEDLENKPNLTGVDRSDDDQWLYSFDDDIDNSAITDTYFHLYEEDGTDYDISSDSGLCTEEGESSAECSTPDLTGTTLEDAADSEFPLGAVEHCAVEDDDADSPEGNDCSTYGHAVSSESGIESGATDAPDLETVEFDAVGELVTFTFDENVSDNEADDVDGSGFYLQEADGRTTTASGDTDIDDIEANQVTMDFDEEDILEAVGAGVGAGTIEDFLENSNIAATVGTQPASPTEGDGTGTATATDTATQTQTATQTVTRTTTRTDGTTEPPDSERVATTLTIRYDRDANQFKGSASSRRRNCQRGRLVTLKKHTPGPNRSVGTDTTNRAGNWQLRKRVRRGRFYAVVAKKVYTNRQGTRIVCLRDKSVTIKI